MSDDPSEGDESVRDGSTRDGEGADPHAERPVVTAGAPIAAADAAVVLLHGRGATADGVVRLAEAFYRHGVQFLAPQASRSRWYPYAAGAPLERNEPHLSSALRAVDAVVVDVVDAGVPLDRVVLFGFSQGASVAAEYAARTPRRYGGVVVCSGGLLGPPESLGGYEGSLEGTPVLVGCGDEDGRVSLDRVRRTASIFRALDGDVTERRYEGAGHEVTDGEVAYVRSLLDDLLAAA